MFYEVSWEFRHLVELIDRLPSENRLKSAVWMLPDMPSVSI